MKDASAMLKQLSRKQAPPKPAQWTGWFVVSAGSILAFVGANNLLASFGKSQAMDLQDPVFGFPFRYILLLVGLAELFIAWICLSTSKRNLGLGLLVWMLVNFAAYRTGLWTMGWHHPWIFVGGLTDALNISPLLADSILFEAALYLLLGSCILLLLPQKKALAPSEPNYFKIQCPACNGKTAFDARWIGQTIPCPHCGNRLPLNKPASSAL